MVNHFGPAELDQVSWTYTEKVWGMPCREIDKDWAVQRIGGLDLLRTVKEAVKPSRGGPAKSLVTSFVYPRLGPGQRRRRSGTASSRPVARSSTASQSCGSRTTTARPPSSRPCGRPPRRSPMFSSMSLRDLIAARPAARRGCGRRPRALASATSTVRSVVDRAHVFPDNWIYVDDPAVRVGRIQNYKNWSAATAADRGWGTRLGLEYFCDRERRAVADGRSRPGSPRRTRSRADRPGRVGRVLDALRRARADAYPVYDGAYREHWQTIKACSRWRSRTCTPLVAGGLHNYNIEDHAMMYGAHGGGQRPARSRRRSVGGEHGRRVRRSDVGAPPRARARRGPTS